MHCVDLVGQKFGDLTVLKYFGKDKRRNRLLQCQCDCGEICVVRAYNLKNGNTKSCGHRRVAAAKSTKIGRSNPCYRHGLTGARTYTIWANMKQRCNNPNATEYSAYGGRGITICDEWNDDVVCFHSWAVANGYSNDLTLDRIDNNGNYEPDNCRWATKEQQYANRGY